MTIQRQYRLPNCTLIVEGLSDSTTPANGGDPRPLLSMLVNAECHIAGYEKPLVGGRDFFVSLVTAVSQYAQGFLSGIHHPIEGQPSVVKLQKVDRNRHRLIVQPSEENGTTPAAATQVDLNTVQLFDLVEAIDQFFADARTLPDIPLQLVPVSKRYVTNREPVAKRAIPATIGVSSLALAAIAFFFVPIPEVRQPQDPTPQPNSGQTRDPATTSPNGLAGASPNPTATTAASPSPTSASEQPSPTASPNQPDLAAVEAALASAPEITDPEQLSTLRANLYDQIDKAWTETPEFDQSLTYRVSVGKDGAILGYRPVEDTPVEAAEQTPLLDLLYVPTDNSAPSPTEPIALFKVVFTPEGVLQVSPWRGNNQSTNPTEATPAPASPNSSDSAPASPNSSDSAPASPTSQNITDPEEVGDLNSKLYDQLDKNWQGTPPFEQDLAYRVSLNSDGTIADYEPLNQPGFDYAQDTPLPNLTKAETVANKTNAAKPAAEFKVVFKPSGTLQVSPWDGYR